MKQWVGLLKKEWMATKGLVIGLFIASFLAIGVLPITIWVVFGVEIMSILPLWLFFVTFTPTAVMLHVLGKETMQPDVWLHSPASIFKLFGAKLLIAAIVGSLQLVLSLFLLVIQLGFIYDVPNFTFNGQLILTGVFIFLLMFYLSLLIVCIALLFRVVYIVIRPYVRGFTGPVMFGVAIFFLWLLGVITDSAIYQKISSFGTFGYMNEQRIYTSEDESSYFYLGGSNFHLGETLINIGFLAFLFIAASLLFEKKVRL